jgi:hypothetical protein
VEIGMAGECAMIWKVKELEIYRTFLLSSNLLQKCVLVNQLRLFGCLMWNTLLSLCCRQPEIITHSQTSNKENIVSTLRHWMNSKGLFPLEVEQT